MPPWRLDYENEEYLGDGLYVRLEDGDTFPQLRLRTPREYGDHVVYLDSFVWQQLKDFVERKTKQPKDGDHDT